MNGQDTFSRALIAKAVAAWALSIVGFASARAQALLYRPYDPNDVAQIGNVSFFAANDASHGVELWRSDGTAAGTYLLADICPGAGGSYPRYFTAMNGKVYFNANDGVHGAELWASDGTAQGTTLVADVNAGPKGSNPYFLTVSNGTLYFQADDGVSGPELWSSDGTAQGTLLSMDIFPGSSGSYPIELTASTFFSTLGTLIFSADDGVHGRQVWESFYPGNSGTVLLKDINPAGGAFPMYFTQAGNYVYFAANDGLSGTELWRTDGTPEGTLEVLDIHAGPGSSMPKYLTAMNGILYFNADDGIHGPQLWRSDGTLAGTYLLDWINPGPIAANPSNLAVQYGRLIFSVYDPVTGLAPWISDGTSAGTVPVHGTAFGAATLQWAPVTQNTDGTPASSLAGYRIYFGTDPASLNNVIEIDNPAADLYPIQQLLPGRAYYFSLTSFTTDGVESDRSAIVAKTLPAAR